MTHEARVLALGSGRRTTPRTGGRPTAIDKQPVDTVEVRDPGPRQGGLGSGVVGDEIGNPRHHGGALQAVYAYPREDLDFWEQQLGRRLRTGTFGENITTVGLDTTRALVGELWHIDDVVLRVEVPRIPCSTFAVHLGEPRWVRRFAEAGRTGAYLSVISPGVVRTGAHIRVERPDHEIDLLLLFRALTGDLAAARQVVDAGVGDAGVRDDLADTIQRRDG